MVTHFTVNPDKACDHPDFLTEVLVIRLTASAGGGPVIGYTADIQAVCAACGERFRWMGLPPGVAPDKPTCSVDQYTLRAPLRPASSDPDFGMGIPGFSVIVVPEGDQ